MAENTGISWTNSTWNPASGCRRISPGCANCYAAALPPSMRRNAQWGNAPRVFATEAYWNQLEIWNRKARKEGKPHLVFSASVADLFEGEATTTEGRDGPRADYLPMLDRLMATAEKCPWLIFQLLTKRTWNAAVYFQSRQTPPNVWIGASVENQSVTTRIDYLRQIPAKVRFLSCEPLLGPVVADLSGISWLIAGGESGHKARPVHPDWVRSLRGQCQNAGIPFFFKQWGEFVPRSHTTLRRDWHAEQIPDGNGWRVDVATDSLWGTISPDGQWRSATTPWNGHDDDGHGEAVLYRAGKKLTGNALDGQVWEQFPEFQSGVSNGQ